MAYGYGSVELFTSTLNTSAPSPAPSPSSSTQPMNIGSSRGSNGLEFTEKEKAHLAFARLTAMPCKGVKNFVALTQSGGERVVMITVARSLGLRGPISAEAF